MLKELSKAHVLKQCDVPKSEQSRVQMEVGRLLREAFAIGGTTRWKAELEDMRVLAPRPKPGSENTSGSDSNDDGAVASFVNRVLITLVEREVKILLELGERDPLVAAIHRYKGRRQHELTNLRDSFEAVVIPSHKAPVIRVSLTHIALATPSSDAADPHGLLGLLSEFERYILATAEIAEVMGFRPLAPGEVLGMLHTVVKSTDLSSKVREWERARALRGESLIYDPDILVDYLRRELKDDELERSARQISSLSLVGGAVTQPSKSDKKGKKPTADSDSTARNSPRWVTTHPGLCMACESPGHFQAECPAPKKASELGPDNPIRKRSERGGQRPKSKQKAPTSSAKAGAYVTTPLHAYRSGPAGAITYLIDTGASCLSYLPNTSGLDPRTIQTLNPPMRVGGITGTTDIHRAGTAYFRVVCTDGTSRVFRFDAAVMPSIESMSIALISPASFVHDGGFHSLVASDPPPFGKGSAITPPKPLLLRAGAVGALTDATQRAEIRCELDARSLAHAVTLVPLTPSEIQQYDPVPALATAQGMLSSSA